MRSRVLAAVLVVGSVGSLAAMPAEAATITPKIERVVILSLPGVTWRDLAGTHLPNLRRFLDGAAVADLSTRAPKLRNDLAGNYASLSAGDKAVGASGTPDASGIAPGGAAYGVDERIGSVTAGELFARRSGRPAGEGLVVLGVDQLAAANAATPFRAEVGVFGDALARAGWRRSVIANGDGLDVEPTASEPRRAATTALMDRDGVVPSGQVDAGLLMDDPVAPFGRRLNPDAVEMTFVDQWSARSVVLVEASDLVRVEAYRSVVGSGRATELRRDALLATDALAARLLAHADVSRDAVVIIGTAPNRAHGRLAAVAVKGPGIPAGLLRSGTTQRTGFVQLMDVAPSVLDIVGVEAPTTMRGRSVKVGRPSVDTARDIRFLVDADQAAEFREQIQGSVAALFLALAAILVMLAAGACRWPSPVARDLASWWALATLAFLPTVYLARLFPFHELGASWFFAWLALGSVALAAVARLIGRHHVVGPSAALLGLTVVVLGVDVMRGSPLQFNGALGFSPEVAGRFIGFGNAGFSTFGAAALFLAVLLAGLLPRRGRLVAVAVLVGAVVVDGAPFWGADVGGVLSLVPAFGLVATRILGWRIRWRTVGLAVAATAAAITAAIAVDLSRPVGSRTHLGRLVEQVRQEGPGEFVDVVTRKLGLNLASFSSSPYRWLVPVAIIGALVMALAARGPVQEAWRQLDPTRALTIGLPTLVLLGYALNDTGVLVPALMGVIGFATITPVITALATAESGSQPVRSGAIA